jgi:hypothetical protein
MKMIADKQKGVSLIITFFVMIIILSVVLSVSALLYSEIKVIRDIGNSVVSFYAADSGVEKVLYYDDQVLPATITCDPSDPSSVLKCLSNQTCGSNGVCTPVPTRGLCTMYPYDTNLNNCPSASDASKLNSSIYCQPDTSINGGRPKPLATNGCDPDTCSDCQVAFNTTLNNGASYYATAKVFPSSNALSAAENSNFVIYSRGNFGGASRQIEILISALKPKDVIQIVNACANPKSTNDTTTITISANVSIGVPGNDTIGSVVAKIYDAQGNYYATDGTPVFSASDPAASLPLTSLGSGNWQYAWSSNSRDHAAAYYVDLTATDTLCQFCINASTDCPTGYSYCCNNSCSTTSCTPPSTPSCANNVKTVTRILPCNF